MHASSNELLVLHFFKFPIFSNNDTIQAASSNFPLAGTGTYLNSFCRDPQIMKECLDDPDARPHYYSVRKFQGAYTLRAHQYSCQTRIFTYPASLSRHRPTNLRAAKKKHGISILTHKAMGGLRLALAPPEKSLAWIVRACCHAQY